MRARSIIDSIWINPITLNGPMTPYTTATQINLITASRDPVALDYWSIKYILSLNWENRAGEVSVCARAGFFGSWLRLSMVELIRGGYKVNIDESYMNVNIAENSSS